MSITKVIGIGGGVGPMAGVKLHELIIQQTKNDGSDQGHLPVIHVSIPSLIPDRTQYLFGKVKEDPARAMFQVMRMIEKAAKAKGVDRVVAGIPCNTFHAPKIWDHFIQMLKDEDVDMQVIHMLDETADLIHAFLPNAKNIGLMSTNGTRQVDVYGQILRPKGYKILEVPWAFQDKLHDSIYNSKWGIKAVSPVTKKARENFEKYAEILCKMGAQAIILGCTEIPLALPQAKYKGIPLIDPMFGLARALIRQINPAKLKPFSLL